MKVLKKLFDFMYIILIIVMVSILIGYMCGIKIYITMSGSMEPNIKIGSICVVNTNITYEQVQMGDIIVFSTVGGNLVTHRAIDITEKGIETKGDNNNVSDGISTTNVNFVGKTLCSIPYIGYIIKYFQKTYVIMIVISLILLFSMFTLIKQIQRRE